MGDDEFRVPRDIVVHLFRRAHPKQLLMLRRTPERGGFWQGVSGAPVVGETDREAAVREIREETGFDVEGSLFSLDVASGYRLDPARQERWQRIYGPDVQTVQVSSFAAEVPDRAPARPGRTRPLLLVLVSRSVGDARLAGRVRRPVSPAPGDREPP
jgi:8-oxo-dGTP pyrophosphatase MutT (NUDIX family)